MPCSLHPIIESQHDPFPPVPDSWNIQWLWFGVRVSLFLLFLKPASFAFRQWSSLCKNWFHPSFKGFCLNMRFRPMRFCVNVVLDWKSTLCLCLKLYCRVLAELRNQLKQEKEKGEKQDSHLAAFMRSKGERQDVDTLTIANIPTRSQFKKLQCIFASSYSTHSFSFLAKETQTREEDSKKVAGTAHRLVPYVLSLSSSL